MALKKGKGKGKSQMGIYNKMFQLFKENNFFCKIQGIIGCVLCKVHTK